MSEPFFLDFFIGLLLLTILAIFYETTVIFYVMLFLHMILLVSCLAIFVNFHALIDEMRRPAFIIGYAIPFIIQTLFSAACGILRARLNEAMTTDDLVLICATSASVLTLPFVIPILQKFIPPRAKYYIYDTGNILEVITNTFILILSGRIGWNVLQSTSSV